MDRLHTFISGCIIGACIVGGVAMANARVALFSKNEVRQYFEKPKYCAESYMELTKDQIRMCDIFKEDK